MDRKERLKILERMAQAVGTTMPPASPTTSTLFPSITIGWDSSRVPYVNRIVSLLDAAAGIGTNGKYTFKSLWDQKFPAGAASEFTSPVKDLLQLFNKVFAQFLNNGIAFQKALNTNEVRQRVSYILNAPELIKLEQVNPTGPLGKAGVSLPLIRQDLNNMLPPTTR